MSGDLLDADVKADFRSHRADVQLMLVSKEEDAPEQEDSPELPRIKEEEEELWTSQDGEQLRGLEDADIIRFTFSPVPVKSEEGDEETPQSSQLHQSQTEVNREAEHLKTEADEEDCGGPEPARNFNPDRHPQPVTDDETSHSSETETDCSHEWEETSEPQPDVQLLLVCKEEEEDSSEQREWSPTLDEKDPPQLPHIKEEQEELWTSQKGEQLRGLDEADIIKFTFTPALVKTEDDEEYLQSSQLHQSLTEQMKTEADDDFCGGSEPARNSNPNRHLQPDTDEMTSDFSEPETNDCDNRKKSSEPQSALNFLNSNSGCNIGEKSFSCSECGKRFSHNSHLKRHMKIHTGEKPFSCSFCTKRFIQKVHLTHHMVRHTGEKLSCSICSKTFIQKGHLTKHMALHTGEKRYSCSVCDSGFTWLYQLKNHHCVIHQSTELHQSQAEESRDAEHLKTQTDGEDCRGPETVRSFNSDSNLQSLTCEKTSHAAELESGESCVWEETSEPQSDLNPLPNREVPVRNTECNMGKTSISSSECGKSSAHKGHLQEHNVIQTEVKPFCCLVCGNRYHRKDSLTTHMKLHSEGKPFSCSVCNKAFQQRGYVMRHMRIHTGEKPFSCSVCGKGFTQSSTLTLHLRVHTGEKPFTCSVCKANFSLRSNLSQHMRMHTGEKPFSCSICGKTFARRGTLRRHVAVHTGEKPFSCSVCGKGFIDSSSLTSHLIIHSGEKVVSATEEMCPNT